MASQASQDLQKRNEKLQTLGLQPFPHGIVPPVDTNSVVNFDTDVVKQDAAK